jgi:hypothetical protein
MKLGNLNAGAKNKKPLPPEEYRRIFEDIIQRCKDGSDKLKLYEEMVKKLDLQVMVGLAEIVSVNETPKLIEARIGRNLTPSEHVQVETMIQRWLMSHPNGNIFAPGQKRDSVLKKSGGFEIRKLLGREDNTLQIRKIQGKLM